MVLFCQVTEKDVSHAILSIWQDYIQICGNLKLLTILLRESIAHRGTGKDNVDETYSDQPQTELVMIITIYANPPDASIQAKETLIKSTLHDKSLLLK